ncbi:MAG: DUF3575 domain-containing protein [Flavobacteriales bacterium]
MKKISIILSIAFISSLSLKAQNNDLSLNVLNFIFSKYELGFEHGFGDKQGAGININFANKNMFEAGGKSYSEFNLIPTYKYYLTPEKGNDGFYLGAYARYRSSNSKDNEFTAINKTTLVTTVEKTDVSSSAIGLGALTGYKWVASNNFFIEGEFGVGKILSNSITVSNTNAENNNTNADWNKNDYLPVYGNKIGVDMRFAFKIGLRF